MLRYHRDDGQELHREITVNRHFPFEYKRITCGELDKLAATNTLKLQLLLYS